MEEKIKVLGVEMNCLTAKETMVLAKQFMENDPVDTIEMMIMDSLMNNQDEEAWISQAGDFKLVLSGASELLEADECPQRGKL